MPAAVAESFAATILIDMTYEPCLSDWLDAARPQLHQFQGSFGIECRFTAMELTTKQRGQAAERAQNGLISQALSQFDTKTRGLVSGLVSLSLHQTRQTGLVVRCWQPESVLRAPSAPTPHH